MWTQIVGKVRLCKTDWVNHSWHATLYLTSRGLTTTPMLDKTQIFSLDFDFIDHSLKIMSETGLIHSLPLRAESVASFYKRLMSHLNQMGIEVNFSLYPNEVADCIPFPEDETHCSYDPEAAQRFWRALLLVDQTFKKFRSQFIGKCSPVHFFWGSFDLAVTRFSGRKAPEHPGGVPHLPLDVAREAYSHEVSSAGFWPGSDQMPFPIFYSYAYPQPQGFEKAMVQPQQASFHPALKEFVLPYEAVQQAKSPEGMLLEFLQSTYEAAAQLGHWDRNRLEDSPYLKALQAKSADLKRKSAA
jgi:hypothetical protein